MILMVIIRYISAILVWILTSLVVLGSLGEVTSCLPEYGFMCKQCLNCALSRHVHMLTLWPEEGPLKPVNLFPLSSALVVSAGTSVLWWLYIDHRLYGNDTASKVMKEEVEVSRDSGQALLVYAVAATVFTVRKPAAGTKILSSVIYCKKVDPETNLIPF